MIEVKVLYASLLKFAERYPDRISLSESGKAVVDNSNNYYKLTITKGGRRWNDLVHCGASAPTKKEINNCYAETYSYNFNDNVKLYDELFLLSTKLSTGRRINSEKRKIFSKYLTRHTMQQGDIFKATYTNGLTKYYVLDQNHQPILLC